MINGVLVEKTVKEVTPALQTNSEGLKKVLEELVKQYKRQQEEMEKWKVSYLHLNPSNTDMMGIQQSSRAKYSWYLLMSIHAMQKKNNIQVVQQ